MRRALLLTAGFVSARRRLVPGDTAARSRTPSPPPDRTAASSSPMGAGSDEGGPDSLLEGEIIDLGTPPPRRIWSVCRVLARPRRSHRRLPDGARPSDGGPVDGGPRDRGGCIWRPQVRIPRPPPPPDPAAYRFQNKRSFQAMAKYWSTTSASW